MTLATHPHVQAPVGSVSLGDLGARGITLTAAEALAVAQSLFEAGTAGVDDAQPPFGPLSRENILLRSDGTVTSRACATTPTVLEAAILIEELLPEGPSRVPGPLRYALARALHEVAAPPYDSLADFSRALRRFETGRRAAIVRGLHARAAHPPAPCENAWHAVGLPLSAAVLAGVALIAAGQAMRIERPVRAAALASATSLSWTAMDARPIVFNPPPLIVPAPASAFVPAQPVRDKRLAPPRASQPRASHTAHRSGFSWRALSRIRIRFDEF